MGEIGIKSESKVTLQIALYSIYGVTYENVITHPEPFQQLNH